MRTAFIDTLCELAEQDERIWLLCGDLGFSVLERYRDRFPDRYINVGVAEQNLAGIAAGLAHSGKVPFIYSIANFPTIRCLEQIRNDICYHNLPVKVVAVGGGFSYGSLGYTHHGLEDLAVMRLLPNMVVVAPGDPLETKRAVAGLVESPAPGYLRLGKANEPVVHEQLENLPWGRVIQLQDGNDITLISTGGILPECLRAYETLTAAGHSVRLLSMPFLAPVDSEGIVGALQNSRAVVTVEEHGAGGLAAIIAELMATHQCPARFAALYVPRDQDHVVGDQAYLRKLHGLDADAISARAASLLSG